MLLGRYLTDKVFDKLTEVYPHTSWGEYLVYCLEVTDNILGGIDEKTCQYCVPLSGVRFWFGVRVGIRVRFNTIYFFKVTWDGKSGNGNKNLGYSSA